MVTGALVVAVFILGLLIGSFLNVVIWRVPRGESVVRPPSHCPSCGTLIRPRGSRSSTTEAGVASAAPALAGHCLQP